MVGRRMAVVLAGVGILAATGCDRSSTKEESEPVETAESEEPATERESDTGGEGAAKAPSKKPEDEADLPFKRCEATSEISAVEVKNNKAFKAFATEVRELGEKKGTEQGREDWLVEAEHRETCRKWLGAEKLDQEDVDRNGGSCEVEFQRNGRAAVISRIVGCGGDDCTAEHYVWPGTQQKPTKALETTDRSEVEVAADLKTLVWDKGLGPGQIDARVQRLLLRGSIEGGEPCALAKCFSPRLTPDDTHVLCRSSDGAVQAIAVNAAFGQTKEVAGVEDLPGEAHVVVQWGVYPRPVAFTGPETFEYTHVRSDGSGPNADEEITKTGKWPAK